jgi:hypothetical protein
MTHPYPTHAVAFALSGVPTSDPSIEANAREPRHLPYVGWVLDYLWSRESDATKRLYGLDNTTTEGDGLRCLMGRRLVESGVRFVQVFPPVMPQFQSGTRTKT